MNPEDIQASSLTSNTKTILIAEDDPFISRMYQTKLTSSGFNVVVKNNGRDAYLAIKELNPDLLIVDINMPEMSGFEVLSALSGEGYDFTRTPVIVLTNSSTSEHMKLAKQYGADYMIKAEMTPHDVLERINEKLGLSTPEAPA